MARGSFPILFITATRIGDAVLSSGLIKKLLDEIPHARFTIVAGPDAAPLFADVPHLERIIVLDKTPGGGHWLSLWSQVRHRKWGLVVDLRGSAINRFLSTRRRAVHRKHSGPPVHKVIEAARVLKLEDDPPAPYLFTSAETEARAEELTAGQGPILALAPAANWVGKTWPIERFAQAAIQLLGKGGPMEGGRLMILGGRADQQIVASLRHVVLKSRFIDLVGKVDVLTAYACLKRARLFIGNDSGLMHMAAAAGAPTLGLFGPSDEQLYGPWGEHARAVRGVRTLEEIRRVDPGLDQKICHMMDLGVRTVTLAARELLEATEPELA
ncbi:MAG: glycosyltransferase family 9 protein [Phenylobacterium sp.]|jgi:ADP-heptose:LPS heptosyltransferase|uniref:glycosyltransferase family 9 protein n=1 Tax=Phenylobacterium sp. TaxID=1871053 RepID=UPI002A371A0E|nr:glycosyltransferase family 9 protein [Phenylobacterium sp.]MDX9997638.1 glycosyltransferase family 9 protein [Phenylobacterium sp.]